MSLRTPKYRLHKGSGQMLVQINGNRIYLGKYGTEESRQRYRKRAVGTITAVCIGRPANHVTVACNPRLP